VEFQATIRKSLDAVNNEEKKIQGKVNASKKGKTNKNRERLVIEIFSE
jgi:hypothetical protein